MWLIRQLSPASILGLCFFAMALIGITALIVDRSTTEPLAIGQTLVGIVGSVVVIVWWILRFRARRREEERY